MENECIAKVLSGKHVLVIGSTGRGKTYWMSHVAGNYIPSFIFVNPQIEREVSQICDYRAETVEDIIEGILNEEERANRIEFIPNIDVDTAIGELQQLREELFAIGEEMNLKEGQWWINVIIDEAQIYSWLNSRTDLENFARRGRRFGVRCWFLSQQPQSLAKGIVNNVEWQVIFRLGQYSAKYFQMYKIPIESHQAHIAKPYNYIIYDGFDIKECKPV